MKTVGDKMELDEVLELIKEVFNCSPKKFVGMYMEPSGVSDYDAEAKGIKLVMRVSDISESVIKSIVQKLKLKYLRTTHNSEKVWVIYTPKKD